MDSRDSSLDALLELDGVSFAADTEGKYLVKFVIKEVPASPERPHGLSYSLTLHDVSGVRLVGFDNAHAAPKRKGPGKRTAAHDHRHRLQTTRPYQYRDAATLLADFWAAADAVLKEKGVLP